MDLWGSVLRERVVRLLEACERAVRGPDADTVGALFEALRTATAADAAAIQVLLTARRIPTLHEEVEPFVAEYLAPGEGDSHDPAVARRLAVFSMMMVVIFADARLGVDRDYLAVLEACLLDTLETDPADVGPVVLRESEERIVLPPGDDLRAQLSYATFGVVGKSGYTRATISRIARRAHCSPGAIYKLYPSKEDLVVAALQSLSRARWMRAVNFVDVLEEGSISQLLSSSGGARNALRAHFTMEATLAAPYNPKVAHAVLNQVDSVEAVIPLLARLSDDEKTRLRYLIRSIVAVTAGVTFLSTVTGPLDEVDFNQFAEPFRRAILKDGVPSWSEMCRQIKELVDERGY